MISQETKEGLNLSRQCKRYGLSLWQCPQFLFLVMGIFIIITSVASYLIGSQYITDPEIVALIVLFITVVLFIIASVITRNFEKLAEVSKMKSEFVNIVSHQLRSPLTNLKWAVEVLTSKEREGSLEKREEYYSSLWENVKRMVELVDDLIIVSRLEEEKVPLSKKEISLEDMVKNLLSQFKFFAEASNIRIEFYPQKDLSLVFTDLTQIKLVIENLIDNAIRYTRNKGTIQIWLEKKNKNILFKIKDSGVGIPEKDQKFIFQKFFRSENALKEQTRGSGLGLYITKSIIEKLGGKIWFESEEGKGTTFYFTLPIK